MISLFEAQSLTPFTSLFSSFDVALMLFSCCASQNFKRTFNFDETRCDRQSKLLRRGTKLFGSGKFVREF